MNQIGTVTESIKAHNMAKEQGWGTMVSHRYLLYISKYSTSMSGPARPRIASSPTWLSALEPARSRLELLAGIIALDKFQVQVGFQFSFISFALSTFSPSTNIQNRSERLAKYNQLLRIEEELGTNAKFAGANFRKVRFLS